MGEVERGGLYWEGVWYGWALGFPDDGGRCKHRLLHLPFPV